MNTDRRTFLGLLCAAGVPLTALGEIAQIQPKENKFARWWCDLNCFRWPDAWGEPPQWIKDKFKLQGRACYELYKDDYHTLTIAVKLMCTEEEIHKYWNEVYLKDDSRFNTKYQSWKATGM